MTYLLTNFEMNFLAALPGLATGWLRQLVAGLGWLARLAGWPGLAGLGWLAGLGCWEGLAWLPGWLGWLAAGWLAGCWLGAGWLGWAEGSRADDKPRRG